MSIANTLTISRFIFVCGALSIGLRATLSEANEAEWMPFISDGGSPRIYEPSAVLQLTDGRLLLVQDEASDPFVLARLASQGKKMNFQRPTLSNQNRPAWFLGRAEKPRGLEDLEGLAKGVDGYLYAITSHSRTVSGKRRKSRERIVRLRIEGGQILEYQVFGKLRKAILATYPELETAIRSDHPKGRKGFNIEGLSFDRDGRRLFIGLRAPIQNGDSLILVLENPVSVFRDGVKPVFESEPLRLDLDKGGIRAISYIPRLEGYLLVTQRGKKKGVSDRPFRIWLWSGHRKDPAQSFQLPGVDLRKTEGIAQIRRDGQDFLLLVSDDGDREKDRSALYLLMPLDNLDSVVKHR